MFQNEDSERMASEKRFIMEVQDAEDAIAQGVYVTSSEVREKLGIRLIGESDLSSSFGSVKSFPDGLSFQKEARNEWD